MLYRILMLPTVHNNVVKYSTKTIHNKLVLGPFFHNANYSKLI